MRLLMIIIAAAVVLVGARLILTSDPSDARPSSDKLSLGAETAGSSVPADASERPVGSGSPVGSEPHPVSLLALAERSFNGRDLVLGEVFTGTGAYTRYHVTYESGGLTVSGIMNIPKGEGPFPLVVLNHGYIDPEVYTNGRGLKREQDHLARHGYAVLHTDYRGHAQSDPDPDTEHRLRLGYVEDAINAVLAVRDADLPGVDASRVGMLGHSMGGGVTLNTLVVAPELVDAAVLFAPVSGDARDNFERWTERRTETAERIRATYGGPEENPAFWDGVSAIAHLNRVTSPVLLHHGTADESTPYEWAVELADALEEAERDIEFHTYEGEPHEFIDAWPLVMRRTVEFFDTRLKGGASR